MIVKSSLSSRSSFCQCFKYKRRCGMVFVLPLLLCFGLWGSLAEAKSVRRDAAASSLYAQCQSQLKSASLECVIKSENVTTAQGDHRGGAAAPVPPTESIFIHCDLASSGEEYVELRDIVLMLTKQVSTSPYFWQKARNLHVIDCPFKDMGRIDLMAVVSELRLQKLDAFVLRSPREINFAIKAFQSGPSDRIGRISIHSEQRFLSNGLFCPFRSSLSSLNLSANQFETLFEIGLGDCPMEALRDLDLSHNNLRRLPRHGISASTLFNLKKLDLTRNGLSLIEDAAFDGLGNQLEVLHLDHNELGSIPVQLFGKQKGPLALKELYLSNNSLAGLPQAFIERLANLVVLNLSKNAISNTWLDKNFSAFKSLHKLVALDLSHNRLSFISDAMFEGMSNLQVLTVAHNQIHSISSDAFSPMGSSLHALVLSFNEIESLDPGVFKGLSGINSLTIDHNRIKGFQRNLFSNLTSLQDLALHSNKLKEIPNAALVQVRRTLRTLDLGENYIEEIVGTKLPDLPELYGLRLAGNQISRLTNGTFRKTHRIKMLNLADNQIKQIDQDAFRPLKKLKALRLDNNLIEDLNGLLTTQHHLQWLNVSYNKLQWFDYAFIPKSLLWLNLRGNSIEEMGNYYDMHSGFHLVHLDISHNNMARLDRDCLMHSLKEVYLGDNLISELAANTFSGIENLTLVDLKNNKLNQFSINSLALTLTDGNSGVDKAKLYLSGNPLQCDCDMEWMPRINQLSTKSPKAFPQIMDFDDLECELHNRLGDRNSSLVIPVKDVRPDEFICPYETHCFALCMCCDFFACDCRMKCSEGCDCYHDQTWSSNIIQCGKRNHQEVPEFIPMDATHIYLDGSNLDDLSTETFIGRKHLRALYLNNSGINVISNKTFNGLPELQVLHLDKNSIQALHGGEFSDLESLQELHLDSNQLAFIHPESFSGLRNLRVLTLANNRITNFALWNLFSNSRLRQVSLAGNPWSCNCQYLQQAQKFIQDMRTVIVDVQALHCVVAESQLTNAIGNASCADVMAVSFRSSSSSSGDYSPGFIEDNGIVEVEESSGMSKLVPILAIVCSAFIIVISLIILAVAFRKPVKKWIDKKGIIGHGQIFNPSSVSSAQGKTLPPIDPSLKPQYDAYVHYSLKDNVFVQQNMASQLSGHRLVLHHRDMSHDSEAIGVVVGVSNKVVLVVSPDYMRNELTQTELRIILDKIQNPKTKVIVVALSSTETKKRLRSMVGTDCLILRWNDSSFWSKFHQNIPKTCNTYRTERFAPKITSDYEDDMWTYVQKSAQDLNSSNNNADSSISTRSTNADTSNATLPASFHQGQQNKRKNVIVNPIEAAATSARSYRGPRSQVVNSSESDYISVNDSLDRRGSGQVAEPIYHTLEPPSPKNSVKHGNNTRRKKNRTPGGSTVYINADLEVVYPKVQPQNQIQGGNSKFLELLGEQGNSLDQDAFEDEELLVDDDENYVDDDFLFQSQCYVPSPAPGPHHLSHQNSLATPKFPSHFGRPQVTPRSRNHPQDNNTYLI